MSDKRSKILGRHQPDRIPREPLWVADWQETVVVRGLSGRERAKLDQHAREPEKGLDLYAEIASTCCLDDDGRRLFSDADELQLATGPSRPLEQVWDKVMELSGIGAAARAKLEKNSGPAPSDDSGSTSPSAGAAP